MTVPRSKRRVSNMAYIETALKIARSILSLKERMPKRYRYDLGSSLFNHATELVYHVQAANRIYIQTDYDFERRRGHLQEAMGHLDHVATLLSIWYVDQLLDKDLKDPNDNVYQEHSDRIERERELIGGVMKRDRDSRGRGRDRG